MEVILTKDVEKVGKLGTVLKVSDGFGRNYLLPHGLAVLSTPAALKKIEQDQVRRNAEYEKTKSAAEALKARLAALSITIPALTKEDDNEKLYGSVTVQDIEAALKEEGFEIEKSHILLAEPIKSLGIVEVPVKLHSEVTAQVKVWIVKK